MCNCTARKKAPAAVIHVNMIGFKGSSWPSVSTGWDKGCWKSLLWSWCRWIFPLRMALDNTWQQKRYINLCRANRSSCFTETHPNAFGELASQGQHGIERAPYQHQRQLRYSKSTGQWRYTMVYGTMVSSRRPWLYKEISWLKKKLHQNAEPGNCNAVITPSRLLVGFWHFAS